MSGGFVLGPFTDGPVRARHLRRVHANGLERRAERLVHRTGDGFHAGLDGFVATAFYE